MTDSNETPEKKDCQKASGCNPLRFLFELLLIAAVVYLGYLLYQKQELPWQTTEKPVAAEEDSQTLTALQSLAVKMGATPSDNLSGKNALDLISDIQIKLDSAQSCNSTLDESEFDGLKGLLGETSATFAKIKDQNDFIQKCSGAKVLIFKAE